MNSFSSNRQHKQILGKSASGLRMRELNRSLALAILTGALGLSAGVASAKSPDAHAVGHGEESRILLEPRAGLSDDDLDKFLKPHGGKRHKLGQSNLHVLELPTNQNAAAILEKLLHNPHLKFAELDRCVESNLVVNDPYLGSEWHIAKVGAPTAWDTTLGEGVTVAILDSGVDPAHPDLLPNLIGGFNVVDNNTNTTDICGHGTAVAGTAAASSNNGRGVAGIAGRARIMPLRIAYKNASGGCYTNYSYVATALTYAAAHGARVANVSFSNLAFSSAIRSAAQYMKNKGGLAFISVGNSGTDDNAPVTTSLIPVSRLSAPGNALWAPRIIKHFFSGSASRNAFSACVKLHSLAR